MSSVLNQLQEYTFTYQKTLPQHFCCLFLKSSKAFISEAVVRRCSAEKVFLEISQNSQENTCARV